jgi:hypothetical protein
VVFRFHIETIFLKHIFFIFTQAAGQYHAWEIGLQRFIGYPMHRSGRHKIAMIDDKIVIRSLGKKDYAKFLLKKCCYPNMGVIIHGSSLKLHAVNVAKSFCKTLSSCHSITNPLSGYRVLGTRLYPYKQFLRIYLFNIRAWSIKYLNIWIFAAAYSGLIFQSSISLYFQRTFCLFTMPRKCYLAQKEQPFLVSEPKYHSNKLNLSLLWTYIIAYVILHKMIIGF